jgi:hypothetical protein
MVTVVIGRYRTRAHGTRRLGDVHIWTKGAFPACSAIHRPGDIRFFQPARARGCTDVRILPVVSVLTADEAQMVADVYSVIPRGVMVDVVGSEVELPREPAHTH